ncbi:phosphopantetheine adenylyltransferase [Candidatus Bathyarchaeota archaeon]|nr:phosphopantetheine adenylyltransferase [Candidatus Bathyarchaeota archaeon]RJS74581.1 MAG: phosphopantetheine adenylyltransferase [Candidatus Bathyarchaeota archaeon]
MRRFKLVAVGGTFDVIHKGHRRLLEKAFEIGERVVIGLTTDTFVDEMEKPHRVRPYSERLRMLEKFLEEMGVSCRARVEPLNDPYGPASTDPDIEAIVVSDETYPRAIEINRIREIRGLKPLKVVRIPMVMAENGKPISTTRIRLGEIDENGRCLKNR